MSKTKAGGSTRNGRDSESKRLGTKVFDGEKNFCWFHNGSSKRNKNTSW